MIDHPKERPRPKTWKDFHAGPSSLWLRPFLFIDWIAEWAAYGLARTALLEFLEYCGTLSILIGVIFYFAEWPERTKLKHYQAWQVINTAQGKGGSGGRGDALHELNEDHVPLVGVDLSNAFLQDLDLRNADLRRGLFAAADLRGADLRRSNFEQCRMDSANLRDAHLDGANFTDAALSECDLNGASLMGCNLHNVAFDRADLRNCDLSNITDWKSIAGIRLANLHGIRNAPDGFTAWALLHGAVDIENDKAWETAINGAATTQK